MTAKAALEIHPTTADVRTHYLYRFFDAAGMLLYVGITSDMGSRLRQHRVDKDWWPDVHSQTVEDAPSRADVLFMEARAILKEHPQHNKDIPTLARFDILRERSSHREEWRLTADERIEILEYQLRKATAKATLADRQGKRLVETGLRLFDTEASLRDVEVSLRDAVSEVIHWKAEAKSWQQKAEENLHGTVAELKDSVRFWKKKSEEIKQPMIFYVDGPRPEAERVPSPDPSPPDVQPLAPSERPAINQGILSRLFGRDKR